MFGYERETETDRNERRYLSTCVPWCLSGDERTVGDSFVASIPSAQLRMTSRYQTQVIRLLLQVP